MESFLHSNATLRFTYTGAYAGLPVCAKMPVRSFHALNLGKMLKQEE